MAYTTPPTFVDGNVLTAAQLNVLSSDIEFLYGLGDVVNVPFSAKLYVGGSLLQDQIKWRIRKKYRYLHYSFTLISGSISPADMRLYYDTNIIYQNTSPTSLSTPQTFSGYVDLNAYSLTTGTWYLIYWYGECHASCIANYLVESSGTSL